MENRKFLLVTLATVLALGMAVAGCSKGSKGGGEAGGGSEPNRLTITGLPNQSFAVYIVSADKDVSSFSSIPFAIMVPEAWGSSLTTNKNVFEIGGLLGSEWSVTGKRKVILQAVLDSKANPMDKNNPMFRTATVDFRNGGATVKFSSFTAITK
jgi:hypothetical protein